MAVSMGPKGLYSAQGGGGGTVPQAPPPSRRRGIQARNYQANPGKNILVLQPTVQQKITRNGDTALQGEFS